MPAASDAGRAARTAASTTPSCSDVTNQIVEQRRGRSAAAARADDSSAPGAPHVSVTVDRDEGQTLGSRSGDVFSTLELLSRIDLRQPVQQVRSGVPGLCAGRLAIPPAAGRSAQPLCAQPGRQDGADRRGRASELAKSARRSITPLQPLSVRDDHRRPGAGSARARR